MESRFLGDHTFQKMGYLLVECPYSKEIWCELRKLIEKYTNICYNFVDDHRKIFFNEIDQKANHVSNFLCLVTKQYLYRKRCEKCRPNKVELRRIIFRQESIEKYIAKKNGKLSIHCKKWGKNNG